MVNFEIFNFFNNSLKVTKYLIMKRSFKNFTGDENDKDVSSKRIIHNLNEKKNENNNRNFKNFEETSSKPNKLPVDFISVPREQKIEIPAKNILGSNCQSSFSASKEENNKQTPIGSIESIKSESTLQSDKLFKSQENSTAKSITESESDVKEVATPVKNLEVKPNPEENAKKDENSIFSFSNFDFSTNTSSLFSTSNLFNNLKTNSLFSVDNTNSALDANTTNNPLFNAENTAGPEESLENRKYDEHAITKTPSSFKGEEDEELVFTKFDVKLKKVNSKEVEGTIKYYSSTIGEGCVRILKSNESDDYRIVFRKSFTWNVLLNAPFTTLNYVVKLSEKSIKFSCLDITKLLAASDDNNQVENPFSFFILYLADVEDTEKLYTILRDNQKKPVLSK